MRKAVNQWMFGEMKVSEMVKLAKKAGFDGIEFCLEKEGECSLEKAEKDFIQLARMARNEGLEIASVATGLFWEYPLTSPDIKIRSKAKDILKKELECAKAMGTEAVLVVPGAVDVFMNPNFSPVPYDEAYKRALETLQEMVSVAEDLGVCIALENVWNKFLLSPLEMKQFIDEINSEYIRAYLDVGNVLLTGFPQHWINILGNRICRVHFKDFRCAIGTVNGFVNLLEGDVPWLAVMEAFKAINYDGWATAEVLPPYRHCPNQIIFDTANAMERIFRRDLA